mmetsp:Transcript_50765/g.147857  ORF Transcript_50765/g.147857 Transcript_50765/m.147857 type:complete len:640 (+) Transcript_50765:50-1969(+)
MAPKYVLSIDQGTTSSRALLFDKDGQPRAKEQLELTQYYPEPGWVEHDPAEIFDAVVKCCQGVMAKMNASKDDIAGIGITNQRETTIAWDRNTGEPLNKAIVWLDLRTADTVGSLAGKAASGKDRFRKKTGLPISTYFSAVKIKWLLDNVPEVKQAAEAGTCCFGTVESWLIYKLTGGKDGGLHMSDISNASRYMLMDLKAGAWDETICKTLGIPMKCLPEIRSNSEVYGHVKGLGTLDGIPISGALGDQHAALLGQGCLEVGSSKNTYGTGCFMLLNTGLEAVPSHSGLLTTIGYKLGKEAPTTYALEGSVACAGRTVQWLRDNFGVIKEAAEVESLAETVEDCGGVTLVPAFSGLFAPYWREDARAVIVGMTLFTKKEHICRAALESVAFSTVDVMKAMKSDTGLRLGAMSVDGGMTVNNLLMQMQADLLGVDVMRAKMPEATVLGAAMAAGLAVGFYTDVKDVKEFLKTAGGHEKFQSRMRPPERSQAYARWCDAVERSMGLEKYGPMQKKDNRPLRKPKFKKVSSIQPEQRGLNLMLKVVKMPTEVSDPNGTALHDVVCGDDSGIVTLRLRPDQFLPCEAGKFIRVQNAKSVMVKGHIHVQVDKWGKVAQAEEADPFEVKMDNDVTAVEYELTGS